MVDHARSCSTCRDGEDTKGEKGHGSELGAAAHFQAVDERNGQHEDDDVGDDVYDADRHVCGGQVAAFAGLVHLVPVIADRPTDEEGNEDGLNSPADAKSDSTVGHDTEPLEDVEDSNQSE